ncbi:MAG: hypothetical protein QOG89_1510, partial [Thermomicrobiales bacterium]|nr:hypothetical protein [Thermomicrobiales bacterium]
AFLYSWGRISFIEMMGEIPSSARPEPTLPEGTTVFGFFREDDK